MIPPDANAEFVCAMEDVLGVYMRPYDPKRPVVCFDELSKQLVKETRDSIPAEAGRKERFDYEYERYMSTLTKIDPPVLIKTDPSDAQRLSMHE